MKIFFAFVGFIVISILVYLGFYNAFYSPKFDINDEGGETIVYQHVDGRYQLTDSVMKAIFDELYERNGIVITKGYGRYAYNAVSDKDKVITVEAGCIVESKDTYLLSEIELAYNVGKISTEKYIVTDFPLKGKMSIMFGMYRVYPKLNKYCLENGYSIHERVIEIYDRESKKIHYRRKLVKDLSN